MESHSLPTNFLEWSCENNVPRKSRSILCYSEDSVVIQKALAADHEVVLAETIRRDHATRLAKQAVRRRIRCRCRFGRGRDVKRSCPMDLSIHKPPLRFFSGSTNVFARTLGLPDDPVEATGILLETMDKANPKSVGLGCVNGRYFFIPCWNGL